MEQNDIELRNYQDDLDTDAQLAEDEPPIPDDDFMPPGLPPEELAYELDDASDSELIDGLEENKHG